MTVVIEYLVVIVIEQLLNQAVRVYDAGNNQPKEQTPKKYASIVPVPNPNMVQKLPLLRPAKLKVKLKVGGKAADSPAGAPAPSNTTNPNPGLASPLPGTFGR